MNLIDEIEAQKNAIKIEWLAEKLNVSRKTLYKAVKRGTLPAFRIGGSIRLNPKSVADWLRNRMPMYSRMSCTDRIYTASVYVPYFLLLVRFRNSLR